ncbi:MAG: transposase, partial [Bacteroidia bacterium]|nr:transposase [Bacteroidia bacterium]
MSLYRNKYRSESARLKDWDYSQNGAYFITLCTQNRECLFGKIKYGVMKLSDMGQIVHDEWVKSFEIRDELFCDEWVIMPNHLHAIVFIDGTVVGTHGRASLQPTGIAYRPPKSVSSFVAGFKSVTTKRINELRGYSGRDAR